jgi:hypothetical protein
MNSLLDAQRSAAVTPHAAGFTKTAEAVQLPAGDFAQMMVPPGVELTIEASGLTAGQSAYVGLVTGPGPW